MNDNIWSVDAKITQLDVIQALMTTVLAQRGTERTNYLPSQLETNGVALAQFLSDSELIPLLRDLKFKMTKLIELETKKRETKAELEGSKVHTIFNNSSKWIEICGLVAEATTQVEQATKALLTKLVEL